MKWKDLSFKERKQIYDSIRANNPDATYFDIRQQFDSIPEYEDGGKELNKEDLPPEYRIGTPEYFERQRRISGRASVIQPEAYITPAGYVKDAMNFIEDLSNNNYGGAILDAALNLIPFGVGKGVKTLKSKVGRAINGAESSSLESARTTTRTKKKTESDYDSEFSEVIRKNRNMRNYEKEISTTIDQAIFPTDETLDLLNEVDSKFGTNYKRAYANIAYKDMTNRGAYVKWGDTARDGYGQVDIKNIVDGELPKDINDYLITLDNNIYMPGTANHELGHIADGIAGSRIIKDIDTNRDIIVNPYLNYLANPNNTYTVGELRNMGLNSAAAHRSYLLNPTESKSHMLTLKRSLINSGKINNWSDPISEDMVLEYIRSPRANSMIKDQYSLYKDKNEYIDRLNYLIPMEFLSPLLIPFVEQNSNDKQHE